MQLAQVLHHIREVIASLGEPLLWTSFGRISRAGRGGREIREIPARDKISQCDHAWVALELPEGVDGEHLGGCQTFLGSTAACVRPFAADDVALAIFEIEKPEIIWV
ncbi:hypothetical protein WMF17_24945 [Sorangium sp. So ce362]